LPVLFLNKLTLFFTFILTATTVFTSLSLVLTI
jgi:hypothetical protein